MAPVDKVPPLPYHYDDLEPYIDTHTMQLHYDGCGLSFCSACEPLRRWQPHVKSVFC